MNSSINAQRQSVQRQSVQRQSVHSRTSHGQRVPLLRSADAAFVTDRLLVGGELHHDEIHAADQLVELITVGVTHLIDLRMEWSDEAWVRRVWPRMQYLHHPVADAGQRIGDDWFTVGVQQTTSALERGAMVLVHCREGVNRAPSLVVAVLLSLGWDVVDAVDLVRTVRPTATMAYAADALDWHHRRTGAPESVRAGDRARLSRWRRHDPLDPTDALRAVRSS